MEKSTKTIVIVAVIVLVLLLIVAIYSAKASTPVNTYPIPPRPVVQPTSTNWLDILGSFIKRFTNPSSTIPAYVQVAPIDDQGCDAYGYNAIGVKCAGY